MVFGFIWNKLFGTKSSQEGSQPVSATSSENDVSRKNQCGADNQAPPPSEDQEDNHDENGVLDVEYVKSRRGVKRLRFSICVNPTVSDGTPMEVEENLDVGEVNIDTSMMDIAFTSQVGSLRNQSTSSGLSSTVGAPQMAKKLAEAPIAPSPAKKKCLRRIEPLQDRGNLPAIHKHNANSSFVSSSPRVDPVGSIPDKENIQRTSDSKHQPLTSKPASQQHNPRARKNNEPPQVSSASITEAIGASLIGDQEGPGRFYFPRTPAVPVGLKRTPFNGELPEDIREKCKYSTIMRKLKVQKDKNFPESTPEGQMIASVLGNKADKKKKATYRRDPSKNDPKGVAVIEKFLGDAPDQDYKDADDKEEMIWSADKLEEHMGADEQKMDVFYKQIEKKYLFAVWRQFESRIPLEFALQKLQEKEYDIPAALGEIDEYLLRLPQKMMNPSAAQVQYLATEFEENRENVDLSWIQDNVMRNFHMAEIHLFYYRFRRFYECRVFPTIGEDLRVELVLRVECNCRQEMCRPLSFEPRYGCAHCTNGLRKHKLPAEKLCLLCATQLKITGTILPVNNVVFDSDDLEKIKKWDVEASKMSRVEVEKWEQDQKNARYKKLQLTQEEVLMLDFEKLSLENLADEVTAQLQPYVLPHFSHCRCSKGQPVANPPPEIPEL